MSMKANEALLRAIGGIDESYIREYIQAQTGERHHTRRGIRWIALVAAVLALLLSCVAVAAAVSPMFGNLLEVRSREKDITVRLFDEIEAEYACQIGETQTCDGIVGTINSIIVQDHHLLVSCTFDWRNHPEYRDRGTWHSYFLPYSCYLLEEDKVLSGNEEMDGFHVTTYLPEGDEDMGHETVLYTIDLKEVDGQSLLGRKLTLRLVYGDHGEVSPENAGFSADFTPEKCLSERVWAINRTWQVAGSTVTVKEVQETALHVTLFIDSPDIGHTGDRYRYMLCDENGTAFEVSTPYDDYDTEGWWFIKPENMGKKLTLQVVELHENWEDNELVEATYDVVCEIPLELKRSLLERLKEWLFCVK